MLVKVFAAAVQGIDATPVTIEVNSSRGCLFHLVGLPDSAVKESHERIKSALSVNGYKFPTREIVINMSPADIRKEGTAYDLPLAIGILASAEEVKPDRLDRFMMMGEISLDGTVKPIKGALPIAILARSEGYEGLIVPEQNAREAAVVNNLDVYGVKNIREVTDFLDGKAQLTPTFVDTRAEFYSRQASFEFDFSEVKGQENVKRALEVAAAGGHNVILADGKGFAECETSWIYRNLCTCLKQQYQDGRLGAFVEGSHLGYWDKGILVNRKAVWIRPDIYVIVDCMLAHDAHTYESILHFDGRGNAELWNGQDGCGGVRFTGKDMEAYVQFADYAEAELIDTEQSSYYNEKHPNKTYKRTLKAEGTCRDIMIINGGEKGKAMPVSVEKISLYSEVNRKYLPQEQAEGLRIKAGDREYVLFLCHREVMTPTDILSWENCLGHGKTVLFDRSREKKETISGEILAW